MAIFGRRTFTPKILPAAGASLDAWRKAADDLDYERGSKGELLDRFQRLIAEQARRRLGAPRRASEARGRFPLTEIIPVYQLIECDTCHTHAPLALMREVIQWQDTTLHAPARVWYACSLGCSQFLQRTLQSEPGARARATIPLIDRGRV